MIPRPKPPAIIPPEETFRCPCNILGPGTLCWLGVPYTIFPNGPPCQAWQWVYLGKSFEKEIGYCGMIHLRPGLSTSSI
jgi:hypothetical protein